MPIDAGCYNIAGRCDGEHVIAPTFSVNGQTYTECITELRRSGWSLNRASGETLCPECKAVGSPPARSAP